MTNQLLLDEIAYWNNLFLNNGSEKRLYELAFFKIFVQFEQFMINAFIHYTIGGSSHSGSIPLRKLNFESLSHLEGVFIIGSKKFLIEKPESIQQLSKHIFIDGHNPFSDIFSDAAFNDNLTYMRVIRNYIAHGSDESLKKYRKTFPSTIFIEPCDYLLKKRNGTSKTNYSLFIELLEVHSNIIYNYTNPSFIS